MEFDGITLRLDSTDSNDHLMMSDISLAFSRTIRDHTGGHYDTYPELTELEKRINTASPSRRANRTPHSVLELSVEEIQICAGLIDPAIRTHAKSRLPVESMLKTRDVFKALLVTESI